MREPSNMIVIPKNIKEIVKNLRDTHVRISFRVHQLAHERAAAGVFFIVCADILLRHFPVLLYARCRNAEPLVLFPASASFLFAAGLEVSVPRRVRAFGYVCPVENPFGFHSFILSGSFTERLNPTDSLSIKNLLLTKLLDATSAAAAS